MVQVHLEACLPDVRVAPVKMVGMSQQSPRRSANAGVTNDPGPLYKSSKNFSRSRSLRESAGEEDVYEEEFGGPADRTALRATSRSKSRIVKDARAELLGLDESLHNVVRPRDLRSRSTARVLEGVDIEMDEAENGGAHVEVSKSRSSSRMKGRSSKDKSDVVATLEASQDLGEKEPLSVRASRILRNGADAPKTNGRLYTGRSLHSTPRTSSRATTPRSSVRSLQEHEESRAPPDVPVREEFQSPNVEGRSLMKILDHEDDEAPDQGERVSYRIPTKSPRSIKENNDLLEERLLRAERLTRKPGRSLRKTIKEVTDMQVEPSVGHAERAPRRNVRKADLDGPDDDDDGTDLHRRARAARQPKRKARDTPRDIPSILPVSQPPECQMMDVDPVDPADPPLLPSSPATSSRSSKETSTSRSIGWLHVLGDLIMWRDVPRSTLSFGAGSFSILSASFMKDTPSGIVAVSANLALCYLAVVFFYRTFLRGSSAQSTSAITSGRVTEADLLGLIRFALPAINQALQKAREVFSGDPATTLKAAVVLWLVAKLGAGVSLWSFLRFGFFALFTIPKCHSIYSTHLYAFAQSQLQRGLMTWDSFTHKKAMLIGGFLFAWNISSYSSRLWGGFILVVWLKKYQQSNPASFEKVLAEAGGSSAIDRIDRRKSLQHTVMASQASQAVNLPGESPFPQSQLVQEFPDRKVNGIAYKA